MTSAGVPLRHWADWCHEVQYHHAVAGGSAELFVNWHCRLASGDKANWQTEIAIGNQETHLLPRGGNDLIPRTMNKDKKRLKQDYQQTPRAIGVFLIRNNLNDKVFVAAGVDLRGLMNRHKFQLSNGNHANQQLQADWNEFGSNNFAFEIVDELSPRAGAEVDYRAEVAFLEDLWLQKLKPFGERGYNLPKLSREEKLRRIAANRRNEF